MRENCFGNFNAVIHGCFSKDCELIESCREKLHKEAEKARKEFLKKEVKFEIYPETPKNKYCHYFTDTCSECGCYHSYRKYADWQKREHIARCFPELTEKRKQLDLF